MYILHNISLHVHCTGYSEQGCHSDNCHLYTVLLYLFHYIYDACNNNKNKIPSPSFDNSD